MKIEDLDKLRHRYGNIVCVVFRHDGVVHLPFTEERLHAIKNNINEIYYIRTGKIYNNFATPYEVIYNHANTTRSITE